MGAGEAAACAFEYLGYLDEIVCLGAREQLEPAARAQELHSDHSRGSLGGGFLGCSGSDPQAGHGELHRSGSPLVWVVCLGIFFSISLCGISRVSRQPAAGLQLSQWPASEARFKV